MATEKVSDQDSQWRLCSKRCHVFTLAHHFALKEVIVSALSLVIFILTAVKRHGVPVEHVHHVIFFVIMFPSALQFFISVPRHWESDPNFMPKIKRLQVYLYCLPLGIAALLVGVIINSIEYASGRVHNRTYAAIGIGLACLATVVTVFSFYITWRAYLFAKDRVLSSKNAQSAAIPMLSVKC